MIYGTLDKSVSVELIMKLFGNSLGVGKRGEIAVFSNDMTEIIRSIQINALN
jgi:hypothetical protein